MQIGQASMEAVQSQKTNMVIGVWQQKWKKKKKETQMKERAFFKYQQDCWMMEEWEQEEGGIPDVMGFLAGSQTESRESG